MQIPGQSSAGFAIEPLDIPTNAVTISPKNILTPVIITYMMLQKSQTLE